jgi:hypothetical protein
MPRIAVGATSTAKTMPIRAGECVVVSTNHGSASHVISVPTEDSTSARAIPSTDGVRHTPRIRPSVEASLTSTDDSRLTESGRMTSHGGTSRRVTISR